MLLVLVAAAFFSGVSAKKTSALTLQGYLDSFKIDDQRAFFNDDGTDFNVLENFLLVSNLGHILNENSTRGITIFAPNDAAMMRTAEHLGLAASTELEAHNNLFNYLSARRGNPVFAIQSILTYHIFPVQVPFSPGRAPALDDMLSSHGITRDEWTLHDADPSLPDAKVIPEQHNIVASNGIMHVVDRLLFDMPVTTTSWTESTLKEVSVGPSPLDSSAEETEEEEQSPEASGSADSLQPYADLDEPRSTSPEPLWMPSNELLEPSDVPQDVQHDTGTSGLPTNAQPVQQSEDYVSDKIARAEELPSLETSAEGENGLLPTVLIGPSTLPLNEFLEQPLETIFSSAPVQQLQSETVAASFENPAEFSEESDLLQTPDGSLMPEASEIPIEEESCFPASAIVHLPSGENMPLAKIKAGHVVRATEGKSSAVYLFTHKRHTGLQNFVRIISDKGHVILLTDGHYLYADNVLKAAGRIQIGDKLRTLDGPASVKSVDVTKDYGLVAPHTLHGDIVVNRIVASTYTTAVNPKYAHALLWPLRALVYIGAAKEPLGSLLYDGLPQTLRSLYLNIAL